MLLYDKKGKKSWVSDVKHLLLSTGFNHVWYEQKVEFSSFFLNTLTQRVKDVYQQHCLETSSTSAKCNYYSILKTHIYTERYLSCVYFTNF